ncbi:MAG: hypothetical protein R6X15_08160, partial [Pseudomonadota bacterium]
MKYNYIKIILLALSLAVLTSCGGDEGFTGYSDDDTTTDQNDGQQTDTSSYSLNAGTIAPVVVVGTTTTINATLLDGDQLPVSGESVTFIIDNGTFPDSTQGSKYMTVTTNADGTASANVLAPVLVGTGAVTVTYGEQSTAVSLQYVADVPSEIGVNASPSSVGAGADSTLTVQLQDQYGNAIAKEVMKFEVTTANSGSPTLEGTGNVATDGNGIASIVYTAGAGTGVDTVSVEPLLSGTPSGSVNINVTASAATISSLTLSTEYPINSMTVGTTQTLQATVLNSDNEAVEGQEVAFVVDGAGDIAGAKLATAVTNEFGVAEVVLSAPLLVNNGKVTASTAGKTDSVSLTYIAGAPAEARLTASPVTIGVSSDSTLTAELFDQYGNVTPYEPVVFSIFDNASSGSLANTTGNAET